MPPFEDFSSEDLAEEIWAMTEREEPSMVKAFLAAMASLLGVSTVYRLTQRVDDGEIMGMSEAVNDVLTQVEVDSGAFAPVQQSVMQQAGQLTADAIGPAYNSVSPRARTAATNITNYLVRYVSESIQENLRQIIRDQIEGVITRDEARRRIRQQVGLLPQHAVAVQNLESNLLASGMSVAQAQAQAAAYAERLLRYRAEMISRTEVARAASVGQQEYWEQLADDGFLPPNTLRKWIVTPDERLCEICGPMEDLLIPLDGFWNLNNGDQVYYPTDSHPNCRCSMGLVFPDQFGKADPLGLQRWLAIRPTVVKHASHDQKTHGNWATGRSGKSLSEQVTDAWDAILKPSSQFDVEEAFPERFEQRYLAGRGVKTKYLKIGETITRSEQTPDGRWQVYDITPWDTKKLGSPYAGDNRPTIVPGSRGNDMSNPNVRVEGSERPGDFVYRVMAESEYQQALERGFFASDQRMNLGSEGTVFSKGKTGTFYWPKEEPARIVRFKYDPEIMYYDKADEYIKTGSHYVDTGEGGYNRKEVNPVIKPVPLGLVDEVSVLLPSKNDIQADREERRKVAKHAEHDQKTHGNWARQGPYQGPTMDKYFHDLDVVSEDRRKQAGLYLQHKWANYPEQALARTMSAAMMGLPNYASQGDEKIESEYGEGTMDALYAGKIPKKLQDDIEQFKVTSPAIVAHVMMAAVEADPTTFTSYRGMVVTDRSSLLKMAKGDTFKLPLSAFTPSAEVAADFQIGGSFEPGEMMAAMDDAAVFGFDWVNLRFELLPGAKVAGSAMTMGSVNALEVRYSGPGSSKDLPFEVVANGEFEVVGTSFGEATETYPFGPVQNVTVTIRQISTFDPSKGEYVDVEPVVADSGQEG